MDSKAIQLKDNLKLFNGTGDFYSNRITNTVYTDGIKYLAEEGNCYWLINDASIVAKSLIEKSRFISIDFNRLSEEEQSERGCEAIITYGDGNDNILYTQEYPYTDIPLDELRLFFVNETLLLPSEY